VIDAEYGLLREAMRKAFALALTEQSDVPAF
jgi:hypothetical protein